MGEDAPNSLPCVGETSASSPAPALSAEGANLAAEETRRDKLSFEESQDLLSRFRPLLDRMVATYGRDYVAALVSDAESVGDNAFSRSLAAATRSPTSSTVAPRLCRLINLPSKSPRYPGSSFSAMFYQNERILTCRNIDPLGPRVPHVVGSSWARRLVFCLTGLTFTFCFGYMLCYNFYTGSIGETLPQLVESLPQLVSESVPSLAERLGISSGRAAVPDAVDLITVIAPSPSEGVGHALEDTSAGSRSQLFIRLFTATIVPILI